VQRWMSAAECVVDVLYSGTFSGVLSVDPTVELLGDSIPLCQTGIVREALHHWHKTG